MHAMDLPGLLLVLVLSGAVCAQDAPRITVVNEDVGVPKSEGSATLGGGGDAMQELLNWAINHSDPERLKELMQKYQENNLTITDVYGKDMIDALFVNEGSVMKDMVAQVADFANTSVTDDDLEGALTRLQELVEQVDNAGNLHRMGGLRPLLELGVGPLVTSQPEEVRRSESVRALALWTLGIALQNNAPVQTDLMDIGGLPLLVRHLPLCVGDGAAGNAVGNEYCGKLLFAVSGLVKNNGTIQAAADTEGLFDWLLDSGIRHPSSGIAKKSLGLLDIALSQSPNLHFLSGLPTKQDAVATSLLARIRGNPSDSPDTDTAEKALRLVNRLVSLRPMLFSLSFRSQLAEAVAAASKDCEHVHGVGDELCEGLGSLAKLTDLALAARELPDDEL